MQQIVAQVAQCKSDPTLCSEILPEGKMRRKPHIATETDCIAGRVGYVDIDGRYPDKKVIYTPVNACRNHPNYSEAEGFLSQIQVFLRDIHGAKVRIF